jgi:hypothetical protein
MVAFNKHNNRTTKQQRATAKLSIKKLPTGFQVANNKIKNK